MFTKLNGTILKSNKYYYIPSNFDKDIEWILGYEPFFEEHVVIASIHHDSKVIYPSHGYFPKHKHAKHSKAIAEKLGYVFNAN